MIKIWTQVNNTFIPITYRSTFTCIDRLFATENISTLLTFVLDNSKLADIGTNKGLGRCMMGMRSSTANLTPLYTARTVQALMGAVYLDSDGDLEKLYEAMMAIELLPKPGAQLPV